MMRLVVASRGQREGLASEERCHVNALGAALVPETAKAPFLLAAVFRFGRFGKVPTS